MKREEKESQLCPNGIEFDSEICEEAVEEGLDLASRLEKVVESEENDSEGEPTQSGEDGVEEGIDKDAEGSIDNGDSYFPDFPGAFYDGTRINY
jgi:hypothetical protein